MSKGAKLGCKRWAPTPVSCEAATHPSHSWDATAQPSEAEGKVRWALLPCHMQLSVREKPPCSSVRAKSHPGSFQILSRKILPENSSYKTLAFLPGACGWETMYPKQPPLTCPWAAPRQLYLFTLQIQT